MRKNKPYLLFTELSILLSLCKNDVHPNLNIVYKEIKMPMKNVIKPLISSCNRTIYHLHFYFTKSVIDVILVVTKRVLEFQLFFTVHQH